MSPTNNNTKRLKSIRKCHNHCGTWIAWNRFIDVKTGEIHQCPTWKARQQQKRSREGIKTLNREEVAYMDTIGPAIAETLSVIQEVFKLVRKMHDSIAKF
jgi:hypothetical protein